MPCGDGNCNFGLYNMSDSKEKDDSTCKHCGSSTGTEPGWFGDKCVACGRYR